MPLIVISLSHEFGKQNGKVNYYFNFSVERVSVFITVRPYGLNISYQYIYV